jgi:CHRD domain-containing protein
MSTQWTIRGISLAGAIWGIAALIDACSSDPTAPTTTTYVAQLSGDNEVPAISGGASGTGTFTLSGNSLSYTVTVNGLSGNAAASHIHMGAAGSNGGILVPFTAAAVQSGQVASGTIDLTQPVSNGTNSISGDSLLSLLSQGLLYTNVHTAAHPGGEIRGQILRSQGSTGSGTGSGSGSGSGY